MPQDPEAWEPDEDDLRGLRDAPVDDDHGFEPSMDDFRSMEEQQRQDQRTRALLELTRNRSRLRAVVLARCPAGDGRNLLGVYPFEGQLWLWQEGRRLALGRLENALPDVTALGPPRALDGGRVAAVMYPIVTCLGCRSDYTPGSIADVVDVVRRSIDTRRPGVLTVTKITSVHDIPLPPGHRLLKQIYRPYNFAWVRTTTAQMEDERARRRAELDAE